MALYKGLIVAYRAPVNSKGKVGFEEKSPIHIADVVRMYEMSTTRLNEEAPEHSAELVLRSILKTAGHEADEASTVGPKRKVRFALQDPDHDGHDGSRGVATGAERPTHLMPASTMRSAHDTEQLKDAESSMRAPRRPAETEQTMPETARRHKSNDGTVSSRTVTRYDANSPEVILDSAVEQNQPNILERDSI